ncbi:2Fe-2S iron-sulfur cluster-binding protein [soil metagenome]
MAVPFSGPAISGAAPAAPDTTVGPATVSIKLDGKTVAAPLRPGETILEIARHAGMAPPFSCEAGNCGTCMAKVTDGHATMRVNDALDDDEVDDGYILTCQATPDGPLTVSYDE